MGNCEKHQERVQHFYCAFHKVTACRVCCEKHHLEPQCLIVELYDVEDMVGFLSQIWDLDFNQNEYQFNDEDPENISNYDDVDEDNDDNEEI